LARLASVRDVGHAVKTLELFAGHLVRNGELPHSFREGEGLVIEALTRQLDPDVSVKIYLE
jgi:hypothetical protein